MTSKLVKKRKIDRKNLFLQNVSFLEKPFLEFWSLGSTTTAVFSTKACWKSVILVL